MTTERQLSDRIAKRIQESTKKLNPETFDGCCDYDTWKTKVLAEFNKKWDLKKNQELISTIRNNARKELIEEIEDILNHSTQIPNELNYIKQKLDRLKEKKQ